ncbi:hypothetical protein Tco_0763659 [Tanacetum coccineum]
MASLKFVDQHNMVACLEKSEENTEFHQIVDFLSTCSINYALTVSPTIYASYIEQFWNTATSKIVNSVKQIHAIVNDRAVVISESSVRNDLLFDDEDGITCLTNDEIFENLALMGYEQLSTKLTFQKGSFSPQWKFLIHTILHCISSKSTAWNEFSTNLASAVICLAKGQKFNFSKLIFDGMLRNLDPKKFLMYPRFLQLFLNNQLKDLPEPFNDTYETPCHTKKVFINMARKGVKYSGKVTPLFDSMLVPYQALEGEGSEQPTEPQPTPSPTHPSTGDQPPSSHDSPLSSDHTSEKAEGGLNLEELFVLYTNLSNRVFALETSKDAQAAEILKLKDQIKKLKRKWMQSNETEKLNKGSGEKGGSTKELVSTIVPKTVSTARPELSTARPDVDATRQEDSAVEPRTPPITTSIFDNEDITIAQTLIKMKEEKAKEKGVSIKDIEDSSRPVRSILTLKPLLIINPKDKGKSVLEEPEPAKKTIEREEEASKAAIAETYDEVQAGIDADALFAAKLQQEEREEYTIEERAKFLAETIAAQRKFRATQRSAKIRSLYERQKRVIDDFKPMDSDDAVKDSKEAAGVHKQKVLEEPNSTKVEVKQEGHEEKEHKLKAFLKIVPDEEGIIYYEVLEKRFPIINWESKFYDFDRHGAECIYYRIFRSDGSSRWIKTFSEMVTRFDRQDLMELYNLVMKRFETTTPEGVNLVLWGDLRTMFDVNTEDELWKYLLIKETLDRMLSLRLVAGTASEDAYTLLKSTKKRSRADSEEESSKKQKLEEDNDAEIWMEADGSSKNYKIFSEMLDDFDRQDVIDLHRVPIHMMIEKKYPLTQEMLSRMLNRRLEVDYESEMAFELLRFTRSQL